MTAEGNRSIELQLVNKTAEEFVVFSAIIPSNASQWITGEQAKVGQTLKSGGSVTWGVAATAADGSAEAEVRLKGSGGSNIGFEFKNLYDGISLVEVELSADIYYSVQPATTGEQVLCKVIISTVA